MKRLYPRLLRVPPIESVSQLFYLEVQTRQIRRDVSMKVPGRKEGGLLFYDFPGRLVSASGTGR